VEHPVGGAVDAVTAEVDEEGEVAVVVETIMQEVTAASSAGRRVTSPENALALHP